MYMYLQFVIICDNVPRISSAKLNGKSVFRGEWIRRFPTTTTSSQWCSCLPMRTPQHGFPHRRHVTCYYSLVVCFTFLPLCYCTVIPINDETDVSKSVQSNNTLGHHHTFVMSFSGFTTLTTTMSSPSFFHVPSC